MSDRTCQLKTIDLKMPLFYIFAQSFFQKKKQNFFLPIREDLDKRHSTKSPRYYKVRKMALDRSKIEVRIKVRLTPKLPDFKTLQVSSATNQTETLPEG